MVLCLTFCRLDPNPKATEARPTSKVDWLCVPTNGEKKCVEDKLDDDRKYTPNLRQLCIGRISSKSQSELFGTSPKGRTGAKKQHLNDRRDTIKQIQKGNNRIDQLNLPINSTRGMIIYHGEDDHQSRQLLNKNRFLWFVPKSKYFSFCL